MKKKIIILSPILLGVLLFFISCCKDDICVNKLKGEYICKVNGTITNGSFNHSFDDSIIIQNVRFIKGSQLIFEMSIDKDSRLYDTLIYKQSETSKDTILFSNYKPYLQRSTPVRSISGFFYLKSIYMSLLITYNPISSVKCKYYGNKK
jgi:hypothetical protein